MSLALTISLVLFVAAAIHLMIAAYALSLDALSSVNRAFFVVSVALCFWGFTLSIANSAPDEQTALLWRQLSALGWGALWSVNLHFILLVTGSAGLLAQRWRYAVLYAPAVVTVFVFGFGGSWLSLPWALVASPSGWVNVSDFGLWDWFYNLYYMSFAFLGVLLLWRWGRGSADANARWTGYLIAASFAIAALVGTLTDIIFAGYAPFTLPELAPAIALIPAVATVVAIRRYGFMTTVARSGLAQSGQILSEASRGTFVRYMSLTFVLAGLLNFAGSYFFYQAPLGSAMSFSALLLLLAVMLLVVDRLPLKADDRDTAAIILVATSIPLIILKYADEFGSTLVWPIPFIFMIASVVFHKWRMLVIVVATAMLTEVWILMTVAKTTVVVGPFDHMARIAIYGIGAALAYFVHRVYLQRLAENEAQVGFQRMMSQLSADFVTVTAANVDEKIHRMLWQSGEHYKVDQVRLSLLSQDRTTIASAHELRNASIDSSPDSGIEDAWEIPVATYPWTLDQILGNQVVHVPDPDDLPAEAAAEKRMMHARQIRSMLCIPVTSKGMILGLLSFASVISMKIWPEDHQELLRIPANVVADALTIVEAEKEISYMAYYDALTGLPNRTLFRNRLEQAISIAARTGRHIAVMLIDLDSFKAVNDTIGHGGGDELLKQVAQRLSSRVRPSDTVSRFGGDEFLVLLPEIARPEDVAGVAGKIVTVFHEPLRVNHQEFFITASAGIAVFPADGEEADTLIKNTDLAMYDAKGSGKNQYTLCAQPMKEGVQEKMQLTNSLHRAQELNELALYYQPQVDIASGEIVGLEALIRWQHPDMGMISPATFVPLAEQTGLINPIGEWVLRTACRQNREWQDAGLPAMRMAVNLSGEQFRNPNLAGVVKRALFESGLRHEYLELEITESSAIKGADYVVPILHDLKALGVSIAIDDFGTEYSSLSRLKICPSIASRWPCSSCTASPSVARTRPSPR